MSKVCTFSTLHIQCLPQCHYIVARLHVYKLAHSMKYIYYFIFALISVIALAFTNFGTPNARLRPCVTVTAYCPDIKVD